MSAFQIVMRPSLGGEGVGQYNSLAQYLAAQLSRLVQQAANRGDDFGIEAALLSNAHVSAMTFTRPNGRRLDSSNVGSGYDLSLFRLTDPG